LNVSLYKTDIISESPGPQPAKNFLEGQSHFWQRVWRHRCAVNHDATFLLWSSYQHWWRNRFYSGGAMGARREDKMGICSPC